MFILSSDILDTERSRGWPLPGSALLCLVDGHGIVELHRKWKSLKRFNGRPCIRLGGGGERDKN